MGKQEREERDRATQVVLSNIQVRDKGALLEVRACLKLLVGDSFTKLVVFDVLRWWRERRKQEALWQKDRTRNLVYPDLVILKKLPVRLLVTRIEAYQRSLPAFYAGDTGILTVTGEGIPTVAACCVEPKCLELRGIHG